MHTAIGRVLETLSNADEKLVYESGTWNMQPEIAQRYMIEVTKLALQGAAHYVVSPKICALLHEDRVERSLNDMVDAGIRELPYDPILLEFDSMAHRGRTFVRLTSNPLVPVKTKMKEPVSLYAYPIVLTTDPTNPLHDAVVTCEPQNPVMIDIGKQPGRAYVVYCNEQADGDMQSLALDVATAMAIGFLLLNTRGIATERVSMAKLNKHRARSGKPAIGDYSVVHVGTIYDREGRAHSATGTGRHMPVHWRAGHVRGVRYGPRAGAVLHRPVYIPPCLVNFDPMDGKAPLPKHEVVL